MHAWCILGFNERLVWIFGRMSIYGCIFYFQSNNFFPISSHLLSPQVLRLSDTSYCIKIKDNSEETNNYQLKEARLTILLSLQFLKVLIFQMRTPSKSSHFSPSVQDFIINLSQLPFSFKIIPADRRRIPVVQGEGHKCNGWRRLWKCDISRKCTLICIDKRRIPCF